MTPVDARSWLRDIGAAFVERLLLAYAVLYVLPFPFSAVPGAAGIASAYHALWVLVVPWIGRHVLGIEREISTVPNGSGDTTFHWVQLFAFVMLATIVATASLAFGRRRLGPQALEWIAVGLRFYLFATMMVYGFVKVFGLQFPGPTLEMLVQRFGDASPMGLAWRFMGHSPAYQFVAGLAEVIGGLLLVPRRTATLGACVLAFVMTNIVAMNLFYDVPVKQFSLHLLAMISFLLIRDAPRLLACLCSDAPVPARVRIELFASRAARRTWRLGQLGFAGLVFVQTVLWTAELRDLYGDHRPKPPLWGLYDVEGFTQDGRERPPLLTDASRWRTAVFNRYGGFSVLRMDERWIRFRADVDPERRTIVLWRSKGDPIRLRYEPLEAGGLALQGIIDGRDVRMRLAARDTEFLLRTRGFRWVSDEPFHR